MRKEQMIKKKDSKWSYSFDQGVNIKTTKVNRGKHKKKKDFHLNVKKQQQEQ